MLNRTIFRPNKYLFLPRSIRSIFQSEQRNLNTVLNTVFIIPQQEILPVRHQDEISLQEILRWEIFPSEKLSQPPEILVYFPL